MARHRSQLDGCECRDLPVTERSPSMAELGAKFLDRRRNGVVASEERIDRLADRHDVRRRRDLFAEPGRGLACDGLVGFRVRVVERQRLGGDPTTGDLAAVGVPAGEPWAAGLPSWGVLVPPGSGRRRLRLRHPPYERRAGYPAVCGPGELQ